MSTNDDVLVNSTPGTSAMGTPLGLIYNQLKIITIILREVYGFRDEDVTLLSPPTPTFITYPTL